MMQWNKHGAARTKSQPTSSVIYRHEQSARSQEPNRPPARVYFFLFFSVLFFFFLFFSISKGETNSSGEDVVESKHEQPLISLLTVTSPTGLLYMLSLFSREGRGHLSTVPSNTCCAVGGDSEPSGATWC